MVLTVSRLVSTHPCNDLSGVVMLLLPEFPPDFTSLSYSNSLCLILEYLVERYWAGFQKLINSTGSRRRQYNRWQSVQVARKFESGSAFIIPGLYRSISFFFNRIRLHRSSMSVSLKNLVFHPDTFFAGITCERKNFIIPIVFVLLSGYLRGV